MLFIQVSVVVTKKIVSEIEYVYRLHHHLCSATSLDWLLSQNLKVQNLIEGLFGLYTKISTHEKYPPYAICCIS